MKPTTSRTGLHKVRVGDRVVMTSSSSVSYHTVTKVGRLFVHTNAGPFRIDNGSDRDGSPGNWLLWRAEEFHIDNARASVTHKIRQACAYHSTTLGKATQDQLDRILAILEEVQT